MENANVNTGFDDKGPWVVSVIDEIGRRLESDDFEHRATITIGGYFSSNEKRRAYAQGLADLLNKYGGGKE